MNCKVFKIKSTVALLVDRYDLAVRISKDVVDNSKILDYKSVSMGPTVLLKTSDDVYVRVDTSIAKFNRKIAYFIANSSFTFIDVSKVNTAVMLKILDWMAYHLSLKLQNVCTKETVFLNLWDAEFFRTMDLPLLGKLISSAVHLGMATLCHDAVHVLDIVKEKQSAKQLFKFVVNQDLN